MCVQLRLQPTIKMERRSSSCESPKVSDVRPLVSNSKFVQLCFSELEESCSVSFNKAFDTLTEID